MARIRTIKPAFFMDEDIAELPAMTRLLYIGLWTLADGHGKLIDRPKRIKAEVFPYDDIDVNEHLQLLADLGFIVRYVVNGVGYIVVPTFRKHQRITGSEASAPSEFPDPTDENTLETLRKQSGNIEETVNVLEGKGRERKGEECARDVSSVFPEELNGTDAVGESLWFTEFMQLYPNQGGRLESNKEHRRKVRNVQDHAAVMAGLKAQIKTNSPALKDEARWWIRGERWKDPLPKQEPEWVPTRIPD